MTKKIFVPYRGIYFLYAKMRLNNVTVKFSSPIGESTFSTDEKRNAGNY